jgi:peptidyl-prolyl cis-trans isomerase SurA
MNRTIAALVLAGLVGSTAAVAGQEVVEEIVAVVNDDIITLTECRQQYEITLSQLRSAQLSPEEYDKQYQQLKKELLNIMITERLLLQKAQELNLNVSEQLKGMIEKLKADNNMASDDDLRRAIEREGMSYERWLKEYEQGMMREAVLFTEVERAIVLDDSEVVQYYKKNPAEFTTPTEYSIRAVYLSGEGRAAEDLAGLRAAVDAKLKSGTAFADVAGELSDPPLKDAKGDLGWSKAGELDETLESAVKKLKAGETSDWVNFKNGWYLLRLEDKKDSSLRGFDDVRKEVEEKLYMEKRTVKRDAYVKTLRERSYVRILKPNPIEY